MTEAPWTAVTLPLAASDHEPQRCEPRRPSHQPKANLFVLEAEHILLGMLDSSGGPRPDQYDALDEAFTKIMMLARAASSAERILQSCREAMPNALGPDTLLGHGLRQPYGHAGDFEIMDRIYLESLTANPLARCWDEYFQTRPACLAVRNRRVYFVRLLEGRLRDDRELTVLNVDSGPARDVADFMIASAGADNAHIDCPDMSTAALAYAAGACRGFEAHVSFHEANVFRWQARHRYDLIWSAGSLDYLGDRDFVVLVRRLATWLDPDGHLVLGNFSSLNPNRDLMEFAKWSLNHRDECELLRLAAEAAIPGCLAWVEREPCGINLFLHLQLAYDIRDP